MYNLLIFRSYNHTIYPKKIKIGWNLDNWLRNLKFWKLFTHGSSSNDHESLKDLAFRPCTRCNFDYNEQQHQESCPHKVNFWSKNLSRNLRKLYKDITTTLENSGKIKEEEYAMEDHPLYYNDLDAKEILHSII